MAVGLRRCLSLTVLMVLTTGATTAQQSSQAPVSPQEIRKLAERLKKLSPEALPFGITPEQVKSLIDELKRNDPDANPQQLAKQLASKLGVTDPAHQAMVEKMAMSEAIRRGQGNFNQNDFMRYIGGQSQSPSSPTKSAAQPSPQATPKTPEAVPNGGIGGFEPDPKFLPKVGSDLNPIAKGPDDAPTGPGGRGAREMQNSRQSSSPTAGTNEQYRSAAQWWERNVGPLDKTPAVRNMLLEMFTGTNDLGQPTGGALRDVMESAGKSFTGSDAAKLFPNGPPDLGGLSRPDIDPGSWSLGTPGPPAGGPSFSVGGGGSWLPMILFAVVAAVGIALFWLWPRLTKGATDGPTPVPGLGPWPLDPRSITDRDGLVRAFEYLSVLLNGSAARTWNHCTIAGAFRRNVPRAAAGADELADAYAVARYTPSGQPMTPEQVATARGHLCRIAGVSPA